jgi:hypothetical protein
MSEAEKIAIRQNFAEELEDTTVFCRGAVSSYPEKLAKAGADQVYVLLTKEFGSITRAPAAGETASRDEIVDLLTGADLSMQGVWDHAEEVVGEGAEGIAKRIAVKGWVVNKS